MIEKFMAAVSWTTPTTGANSNLNDPGQLATMVVDVLTWAIGVLAIVFIVVGGIKYATSGGDEKKVASAKNTILYAVIGLVLGLLANTIIKLVLSALGITGTASFGAIL